MAIFGRWGWGLEVLANRRPTGAPSRTLGQVQVTDCCELCRREELRLTVHHLIPRAEGGRLGPKTSLCSTCHRQLHALFSGETLAKELTSLEAIRADPQMSQYLKWARRQKSSASFQVRRSNHRR